LAPRALNAQSLCALCQLCASARNKKEFSAEVAEIAEPTESFCAQCHAIKIAIFLGYLGNGHPQQSYPILILKRGQDDERFWHRLHSMHNPSAHSANSAPLRETTKNLELPQPVILKQMQHDEIMAACEIVVACKL
jgi:hypothetical protein